MRLSAIGARAIVGFALLASCDRAEPRPAAPQPPHTEIESLQRQLDEEREKGRLQREYVEEATRTISAIHERLASVGTLATAVRATTGDIERGDQGALSEREELLKKIDSVKNDLEENAKGIAAFREKTAAYDGKLGALETTIDRLQTTLQSKEREISDLRSALVNVRQELKLAERQSQEQRRELSNVSATLAVTEATVDELRREASAAWYVIGEAKPLIENGIIEQKGGLFRRKVRKVAPGFQEKHFLPFDIERHRSLEITHRSNGKVELVSPHAPESYRLVPVSANMTRLEIIDPSTFWRIRYLVVLLR